MPQYTSILVEIIHMCGYHIDIQIFNLYVYGGYYVLLYVAMIFILVYMFYNPAELNLRFLKYINL